MKHISYLFLLIILIFKTGEIFAQWSTDPSNNLIVGYGLLPELCSDSAGGCYITYEQNLTYPRHLVLERLNRYGYKPWGSGKQITGFLEEQSSAKIVEDGSGGVIVLYLDNYYNLNPNTPVFINRLRVQRIDSSGNFLWRQNGVRVSVSETNQGNQAIISDGNGGCIVAWTEGSSLMIQRIDSSGIREWGDNGIYVWNSPEAPPMISDSNSGCYILYGIGRLQRFLYDGSLYWPFPGILIPSGPFRLQTGFTNVYLLCQNIIGFQNGQLLFTYNMQKVDDSGKLVWDSMGVVLDTLNTNSYINVDFSFQNGYSTIVWPQNVGGVWDLRTQIVRSDGSTIYPYGGMPISKTSSPKGIIGVIPSDSSNSTFVWFDERSGCGTYAQKQDTLGNLLWDTLDVLVSLPELSYGKVITDCNGGFIVVGSRENFTIRAQQVSKYGNLGEVITSIDDDFMTAIPQEFKLYQNYPNPFNSETNISLDIPAAEDITINLYDVLGRNVKTLINQYFTPGSYRIILKGGELSSGTYFYKMQTSQRILVHEFNN